MLDDNRLRRGVPHDHSPLVREIRVHGAGRVRNTEPLLEGCSTPRTHLGFVSIRQPRLEAERDQRHRACREGDAIRSGVRLGSFLPLAMAVRTIDHAPVEIGAQIVAGGTLCGAPWRLCILVQELDDDRNANSSIWISSRHGPFGCGARTIGEPGPVVHPTPRRLPRLVGAGSVPVMISPWIAALLLQSGSDTTALMTPGVSRALATHRAKEITDVRYALSLDVARLDTARGHIPISLFLRTADDVIVDFRGPKLFDVTVNAVPPLELQWNGAHVRIPARMVRAGQNVIDASFATLIAPAGTPIIHFHDETDARDYLYTLLVPSDAHALFPRFDQPDLKARLTLDLRVPSRWTAIANGRPSPTPADGSTTTIRFSTTDPLPTYLFAFAAGPYARFTGGPRSTPLLVRASRAREVEVDSLQNQVASAL